MANKEYNFNKNGKEIKVVYAYEKKVIKDIRNSDGYEMDFGKKIYECAEVSVLVNGQEAASDREIHIVTEASAKNAMIAGVKAGMMRIGSLYFIDQEVVDAVVKMAKEAKIEGTTDEAKEMAADAEKAAEAKKIENCKKTVARAEAQSRIPTADELERILKQDESVVAIPDYITQEDYQAAKAYLASK